MGELDAHLIGAQCTLLLIGSSGRPDFAIDSLLFCNLS